MKFDKCYLVILNLIYLLNELICFKLLENGSLQSNKLFRKNISLQSDSELINKILQSYFKKYSNIKLTENDLDNNEIGLNCSDLSSLFNISSLANDKSEKNSSSITLSVKVNDDILNLKNGTTINNNVESIKENMNEKKNKKNGKKKLENVNVKINDSKPSFSLLTNSKNDHHYYHYKNNKSKKYKYDDDDEEMKHINKKFDDLVIKLVRIYDEKSKKYERIKNLSIKSNKIDFKLDSKSQNKKSNMQKYWLKGTSGLLNHYQSRLLESDKSYFNTNLN